MKNECKLFPSSAFSFLPNFIPRHVIWSLWKTLSIYLATSSEAADIMGPGLTNFTQRLSKILHGYDVRLRPNFGADPLYVGIEIKIAEINEFSEVNMDYTITLFLNQYWKDERLAFSTGEERLTFTGDFTKRIWVPDIFFPADKDSFIHDVTERNQMVQLSGDGSILYGMRFTTRESCGQMDLRNFPLDSQNCTVEIESYGYTVRDLRMYWKDDAISGVDAIRLPQLRIVDYETNDRIERLATGVYQRLSLSLKFERHFGFFFFQMYLPAILIVMLSWVSFWISNDATAARVALGITTVLTMTTISNSVRSSLPRISYIKAIDVYLVICFLFVFAALIEYAAVNYIFWERKKLKKRKRDRKPGNPVQSRWRRHFFNSKLFPKDKRGRRDARSENMRIFQKDHRRPKCSIEIDEDRNLGGGALAPTLTTIHFSSKRRLAGLGRSSSFSGPINTERISAVHSPIHSIKPPPSLSVYNQARVRFMQSFKNKTSSLTVHDVSSIDNYSRIIFPATFILFNAIYWSVYINKS